MKLSDNQSDGTGTCPSSYYRTRVLQARQLLLEAADDDAEYVGDMIAEGVREGRLLSAIAVLDGLISVFGPGIDLETGEYHGAGDDEVTAAD